jgi:diguanylate cyclase (GGDEF)-like protein
MSSWLLLGLALAALVGLGTSAILLLHARSHQQAANAAIEDAHVISSVTALRDLGPDNATEPLSARARADLNGDVAKLTAGHDVLGLSIRRLDGTVLYHRGVIGLEAAHGTRHLPTPGVATVRFFDASSPTMKETSAITVESLAVIDRAAPPLIITVTIPASSVEAQSRWATTALTVATLIALLLSGLGLITTRRRVRQRGYQASHDRLTGLGNRVLLEQATVELFDASAPFALVMMDLDGFKRVNDSLGHAAGEVLLQVADALRASLRPQDVLVRLGGDEFAVLMPDMHGPDLEDAATRLLSAVRTQFTTRGVAVDCDASVGAAVARQDGDDFGELLQAADIAMYQAKRGKLGVRMFADSDEDVNASDLQTLVDLRAAIDGGQLRLHYQPAVALHPSLGDGPDHYLEALVRWEHPTRGFLSPDSFIPLAEDTALIHPLTAWVLNEATRQCAAWRLDGLNTTIAVNVSPRSLTYSGLVRTVVDTLARHQLPASAIHLEITESAVISRPELARSILIELRDLGICISIDDFGTGYTSLAHLKTLPVETLKIDRCFVQDMLTEPSDETVVAAIINLAHGLGMKVVAEGIEDEPTLQRVISLGCDIAQGFYLSRPLSPGDALRWLRHRPEPDRAAVTVAR